MPMMSCCCGVKNCLQMWMRTEDPRIFEFDAVNFQLAENPLADLLGSSYTVALDGYPTGPKTLPGGARSFGPGGNTGVGFFNANSRSLRYTSLLEWPDQTVSTVSTDAILDDGRYITPPSFSITFGEFQFPPDCNLGASVTKSYFNRTFSGVVAYPPAAIASLGAYITGGISGNAEHVVTGAPIDNTSEAYNTGPDEHWTFDSLPVAPNPSTVGFMYDTQERLPITLSKVSPAGFTYTPTVWFVRKYNSTIGYAPIKLDEFPQSELVYTDGSPVHLAPTAGGNFGHTETWPSHPSRGWLIVLGSHESPDGDPTIPDVYEADGCQANYRGGLILATLDDVGFVSTAVYNIFRNEILGGYANRQCTWSPDVPYSWGTPTVGRVDEIMSIVNVSSAFENGVFIVNGNPQTFVARSTRLTPITVQSKRTDQSWGSPFSVNHNNITRVTSECIFPPDARHAWGRMPPAAITGVGLENNPTESGYGFYQFKFYQAVDFRFHQNEASTTVGNPVLGGPFQTQQEAKDFADAHALENGNWQGNYANISNEYLFFAADLDDYFVADMNLDDDEKSSYQSVTFNVLEVPESEWLFPLPALPAINEWASFLGKGSGDSIPTKHGIYTIISGFGFGLDSQMQVQFPIHARNARPTYVGEADFDFRFVHSQFGAGINQQLNYYPHSWGKQYGAADSPPWESEPVSRSKMRRDGELVADLTREGSDTESQPSVTRTVVISVGAGVDNLTTPLIYLSTPDYDDLSKETATAVMNSSPKTIEAVSL